LDSWTPFVSTPRWYDAIASPYHLFSCDHDHVVETSRADHYRAPCGNRQIALLVPTSVGWDDRCVPLSYKKGNPSAMLPLLSLACFRARQCRHSCFPLRLVLVNPPLAHPRCCFALSLSKLFRRLRRQPPEEARRRPREEPGSIVDHASVRGDVRVPPLDTGSDVPLHRRRSLSSFSFPCTHPSPAPPWAALRQRGEHHVSFALSEFSLSRNISEYVFHLCNPYLVRRCCYNLVVESRDEILFKGGRLWRPRFSARIVNPNEQVYSVDFSQTMVNLGHHLENNTDKP
jgi:hypothetical protein